MKNTFKKVVAALMASVSVASVMSGCNPRDSYAAEVAFGLIPAEAEARNDLDEGYERIKSHPGELENDLEELNATRTELENALKELEAVRAELEATREELEAVRADLDATREELANYQKKLE